MNFVFFGWRELITPNATEGRSNLVYMALHIFCDARPVCAAKSKEVKKQQIKLFLYLRRRYLSVIVALDFKLLYRPIALPLNVCSIANVPQMN